MVDSAQVIRFYRKLPKEFTRKEALKLARELGYSRSWLYNTLQDLMWEGILKRKAHGRYRKGG